MIAAAVVLVDEVKPRDFSMRLLAQRLGSSTASLYRNFKNKDEILVHVVDHVLGEVPTHLSNVDDGSGWQERLIAGAEALFRTLKQHPNLVPLLDRNVPIGPRGLAVREAALATLLSAGFSPEMAASAYTTIAHYVIGFASQLREAAVEVGPEDDDVRTFYRSLDNVQYAATIKSAAFLPRSLDDEFRFGLQLIVDGLAKRLD